MGWQSRGSLRPPRRCLTFGGPRIQTQLSVP